MAGFPGVLLAPVDRVGSGARFVPMLCLGNGGARVRLSRDADRTRVSQKQSPRTGRGDLCCGGNAGNQALLSLSVGLSSAAGCGARSADATASRTLVPAAADSLCGSGMLSGSWPVTGAGFSAGADGRAAPGIGADATAVGTASLTGAGAGVAAGGGAAGAAARSTAA